MECLRLIVIVMLEFRSVNVDRNSGARRPHPSPLTPGHFGLLFFIHFNNQLLTPQTS